MDDEAKNFLWIRCATDLELYAKHYFPHYCQMPFNELHFDLFDASAFGERAARRARAAPRGYAKSTVEAFIQLIHDVCYGLESFIVIFSNTQDQANQKLKDIRTEILTNDALIADYGVCFSTRKPGETQYTILCGAHACLFLAFGSGTEVRGIRFGADRPSKIVVDDGEHSEEVLNEAIRYKYEDWMFQVVSKLGNTQTNIHVIGTILHPESLLAKLIVNPAYDGKIYKAVISWSARQDLWEEWKKIYVDLDNPNRKEESEQFYKQNEKELLKGTKVLWPEKESYLYLQKELIETGRRAFFKEKQNEPIGGDQALFDQIHWYRETDKGLLIESNGVIIPWDDVKSNGEYLNSYGALDPSVGNVKAKPGKLGDYTSLVSGFGVAVPGREYRLRLFVQQATITRSGPSKWIKSIFEHNEIYNYKKFAIETNLFRELLMPNIEAARKVYQKEIKKEIHLPFYDVINTENKEKRIHTLEPQVQHGWILFNRNLDQTAIRQLEGFPLAEHDDFPDSLHMLWNLVNNRYRAGGLSVNGSI